MSVTARRDVRDIFAHTNHDYGVLAPRSLPLPFPHPGGVKSRNACAPSASCAPRMGGGGPNLAITFPPVVGGFRLHLAFAAHVVETRVRRIAAVAARRCKWPRRVPCPECRCKRRLTQEFCGHCGSPFPAPRPDGTEIISDLAGERFLFWAPGIEPAYEALEVAA